MRDALIRDFLEVVRGEPVVLVGREPLEIPPGLPRDRTQALAVLRPELLPPHGDGAGELAGAGAGFGAFASARSSSVHWALVRAGVPSWNWRMPSPPSLNRSEMKPVMVSYPWPLQLWLVLSMARSVSEMKTGRLVSDFISVNDWPNSCWKLHSPQPEPLCG